MLKSKLKIFVVCLLITILTFAFSITAFAEVNNPSFFSAPDNVEGMNSTGIITQGGHIFLSKQNLTAIEEGMKIYLDVLKDATAEGSVTKHYAEVIKYRNIRLILFNGTAYAPFVAIDNTKTSAFYHDKILWCSGAFSDLPTALAASAPTCDAANQSVTALCGGYNTSVPRFVQFAINQSLINVLTYHLQMYDATTNELLGDYVLSDLKVGNYTGYESWAATQSYTTPDPGTKPTGMTVFPEESSTTSLEIVGGKPDTIKNSEDQVVGVKLTLKYKGDSTHVAKSLTYKDPNGNVMAQDVLTDNSGTVTKSFNNLVDAGTSEKPYSVELVTVVADAPVKKVTYTFANPTVLEDNNYNDHAPVITYSGLTGIPTYPQNTEVTITIMTDVASDIKVNGGGIVNNGTAGNYIVTANTELHVTAEANGQVSELTIPVNEFTDEIADIDPSGIDNELIDDKGNKIGKDGVVRDKNGNVIGLADGNGNILDAFGNKIGSYTIPDKEAKSTSDNKASNTNTENEKLTQTGIYSSILIIGGVLMILGCFVLFGGRIYAKKNTKNK